MKKLIACLLLFSFGCAATSTDAARKSLNTAEELRQIAARSLDDLDARKQSAIVAQAEASGDIPAARAALDAWWKERFSVEVALSALKGAILVAESVISSIEAGSQKKDALSPAMQAANFALQSVLSLLANLGVKLHA